MNKNDFQKSKLLYNIAVDHEISLEHPDDISLSIHNMLTEIRELGYEEFNYLSDIKLRNIKNPRIMKILFKYYEEMDLFTKDCLMYKIHPRYCPEIIEIAKEEFLKLSPLDRKFLNGFQIALSKAKVTDSYLDEMFKLLEIGEQYEGLSEVRKKLCKSAPERMLPIIDKYCTGLLILNAIQDCVYIPSSDDIIAKLSSWTHITDEEIKNIQLRENNRELSITNYEYYRNLCTKERIKADAKKVLKIKIKQK